MVLYGTFSPAQWQIIKTDLAVVGIDLDANLPSILPSMPDDPPWWLQANYTLRNAIQDIAWEYGMTMRLPKRKPRTPTQRAESLAETLAAYETVLAVIDRTDLTDTDDQMWTAAADARIERRDAMHDMIMREIADLQERIAALTAKGSARAANPKTIHNDYWREQAQVWLALKPNVSSRDRRGHLRRYLLHCSASLFVNQPEIESKIAAFVGHFFTSKQSPK
jgi:hypothetical protein